MSMNKTYSSRVLLTRQEAADRLRVSLTTMSAILASGDLYYFRWERQIRIPEEALDDYISGVPPRGRDNPLERDDTGTYPATPSMLGGEPDPTRQPEPGTWPPTSSLLDSEDAE